MNEQFFIGNKEIKIAKTQQEKEAIYRFRYQVFFKDLGRKGAIADHEKKWLKDKEDEDPDTILIYLGNLDNMRATIRLIFLEKGKIPEDLVTKYSIDELPSDKDTVFCFGGKLMAHQNVRGLLKMPSLFRAGIGYAANIKNAKYCLLDCSLGLIPWYEQFGFKTYAKKLVTVGNDYVRVAMVLTRENMILQSDRSPLAALWSILFTKKKENLKDFENETVIFNHKFIFEKIRQIKKAGEGNFVQYLSFEALNQLCKYGVLLRLEPKTIVTSKNLFEKEIYIVINGAFKAIRNQQEVACFKKGDVFGEIALFLDSGKRTADVLSVNYSEVLVINRKAISKMERVQSVSF